MQIRLMKRPLLLALLCRFEQQAACDWTTEDGSQEHSVADDKPEDPIEPGSSYLRRRTRTLKEAEQDKDASDAQWRQVPTLEDR